jgi:hypothetical protein
MQKIEKHKVYNQKKVLSDIILYKANGGIPGARLAQNVLKAVQTLRRVKNKRNDGQESLYEISWSTRTDASNKAFNDAIWPHQSSNTYNFI